MSENFAEGRCLDCRRKIRRMLREDRIDEKTRRARDAAVRRAVGLIRGDKIDAPHVSELVEAMFQRFGGVEQFSVEWHIQIMKAAELKPGSKTVLDAYRDLAKLVVMSTEHRASAPDLDGMEDAEIEAILHGMLPQIYDPQSSIDEVADDDAAESA